VLERAKEEKRVASIQSQEKAKEEKRVASIQSQEKVKEERAVKNLARARERVVKSQKRTTKFQL